MEEPQKNLKTLLTETLELRNISQEKLAQLTGISEHYIWAIQNMEINKLPSAPYVHGYIKKISAILRLNHDEIWELYKKELEGQTSGKYDMLPANRFAIRQFSRRKIAVILLTVFLIIYLLANAPSLIGKPKLSVINPQEQFISIDSPVINLIGRAEQKDKLTINNEEVFIEKNGDFSKEYALQPGINNIEFKSKRFLGKETTIRKQILYQLATPDIKINN